MSTTTSKKVKLPPPIAPAKYEQRSIFLLRSHPKQEHYFADEEAANLDQLAKDILANGLREALEITPDNVIISGHRRSMAIGKLYWAGHKQFEVMEMYVRYDLAARGEDAIEHRLIEANANRRHQSQMEIARCTLAMYKLEGGNSERSKAELKESIAARFDKSPKTLERLWPLLELPIELQRLVDRKKIPLGLAHQILDFATAEEIEIMRRKTVAGIPIKDFARQLLRDRIPPTPTKEPPPAATLERFLDASLRAASQHNEICDLLRNNLRGRRLMLRCLTPLRVLKLMVPEWLEIALQSDRLVQEDLERPVTLGKRTEKVNEKKPTPPLKLRPAKPLPPLKLVKPPAA